MAVVVGLVHPAVPQGDGEVEQKTVGLSDPLLGVYPQARKHSGAEKHIAVGKAGQQAEQYHNGLALGPPGLGGAHPYQKQVADQQDQALADVIVEREIEAPGYVGGSTPAGDVRREQDSAPEPENVVVQ